MKTALILFAHGARDAEWANPMRNVQALIRQQCPGAVVSLAFLEFMAPTLADTVNDAIAGGADKVVILPMFIARGGHLRRELPEMVDGLRTMHPQVDFVLLEPVGEQAAVMQAMAGAAIEMSGLTIA